MRFSKLIPLVFSLLLISVFSFAQVQPPGTPAGRQCAAWLASFSGGDRNAYREFLEKNYPDRVKDLDRDLDFRRMTGGFDFKKAEESTPTKLTALVQERQSDQMARLVIEVEAQNPITLPGSIWMRFHALPNSLYRT